MSPPRLRPIFSQISRYGVQQRRHHAVVKETVDLAYDRHDPPGDAPKGNPIVFVHGFFGSKKNNRTMSKILARDLNRPVYAVDLRNHGESPHSPHHTYPLLARDLLTFLNTHSLKDPTLIGHSMGAKVAMCVALEHPSTVKNLIPVDNAPVDASFKSDFGMYLQGMREVARAKPKSLKAADQALQPYAKVFWPNWAPSELAVRQFLLTNLVRHKQKDELVWRVPVEILSKSLDNMMDFPYTNPDELRYEGPTLFIRGTRSVYVADETLPTVGRFFPRFELRDVEAGHWVISENPEKFREAVVDWLQDKE